MYLIHLIASDFSFESLPKIKSPVFLTFPLVGHAGGENCSVKFLFYFND